MENAPENPDSEPEKILLIDDDSDMREYGCRLLRQFGYEPWEAADGRAALEFLEKNKPDLIVADVMMPRLSGIEFLRILRSGEETREIPVILLSARYGEDARIEGLDAGADDYIEKPFSPNELRARIKTHLKMARIRSHAAERERELRLSAERSAEALRESEERLRLVLESVEDYAVITADSKGNVTSWNSGAEKAFGWAADEAVGQSIEIIFTPEDCEEGVPEKERQTALQKGRADDERWHVRKDGSRFYVSGVMSPLKDGGANGFVKIARDQTERIKTEKAVRDREIMQRIIGAQEDERQRIARDLHDELGQQLTALRLKLERVKTICEDEAVCDEIDEIQAIAGRIDDGVDFLAWELRPAVLDDLGLVAALDKYVMEWSRYSGVPAELLPSRLKRTRFAPEIETNLYRIAQEALNNTHKHARATNAEIVLERRDDAIILIISDDGKGFDPEENETPNKGIGLIGMKERATLIGGNFEIESAPGQGTTVYARVPALFLSKNNENSDEG